MIKRRSSYGFSMLEMSLVLGISGALVGGAWQMMTTANLQGEAQGIASQTMRIGLAAQNYINSNSATLLALVPTLNSAAKVKLSSTDTGSTADSVIEAGYLPTGFNLTNAYQQNYAFYIQRIDAGTLGAADPGDRLVGLLITKDGGSVPMSDKLGAILSSSVGTAGGFIYLQDHTAYTDTATLARGTNGSWQINLAAAPWSGLIGADGKPGHIAVMTNLLPNGTSASAASGGGGGSIDDLSDGKTDYDTDYNVFIGENSGDAISAGGQYNTGAGYQALQNLTTGDNNQALGYQALQSAVDGSDNIAAGSMALQSLVDGSRNIAVGYQSLMNNVSGNENVAHGYKALYMNTASGNTAIGYEAMLNNVSGTANTAVGHNALMTNVSGTDNTAIGSLALKAIEGSFNTAVGSSAISKFTTGNRNTALGYATLNGAGGGNDNTAIGSMALSELQTGSQNTALGMSALKSTTTGSSNTALGYAAAQGNTDGSRNTVIGALALTSQTSGGDDNTIAGFEAAKLVDACTGITIAGYQAASTDTTCPHRSSALGYRALYQSTYTTSGEYSSVMGYNAMPSLNNNMGTAAAGFGYNIFAALKSMNGDVGIGAGARASAVNSYFQVGIGVDALPIGGSVNNPVAVGYQAFKAYVASDMMTSPANGVAIGYQAMLAAINYFHVAVGANAGTGITVKTTPSYLIGAYAGNTGNLTGAVGIGYQAAKLTSGSYNVVVGSNALVTLPATAVDASYNVAIGFEAAKLLTTAATNTIVGAQAASKSTSAKYSTAIGYQAMLAGNPSGAGGETCTGFGSNVNFGYSGLVATCTRNTAFGYAANFGNRTGTDTVAIGYMALASNASAPDNTAIGSLALGQVSSTGYNTAVGYKAGYDNNSLYSNTTTIGYNAQVGGSNEVRFGDTNVTWIGGQVIFTALSDRRDKKDIANLDLGLDFIRKLRPVSFRMNNGNERLDYGFIAQEVQEALGSRQTNLVRQQSDERGSYVMRYNDLIAPVVKGLQEQHGNLKQAAASQQSLEKQADSLDLATLKARLEADQARLNALKSRQH